MNAAPDNLFKPDVHRAISDELGAEEGSPVRFLLQKERALHLVVGGMRFHLRVRLLPQRPVGPTAEAGLTRHIAERGKKRAAVVAAEPEGEDQPADDVQVAPLRQDPQRWRDVDR